MNDAYQYETPLSEVGELRLLLVTQASNGGIQCNFVHASLIEPKQKNTQADDQGVLNRRWSCDIPYFAISYTWGTDVRDCAIEVEGRQFHVTQNLFMLLQDICLKRQEDLFWIDAICINQEHNAEKSHQVRQMPCIYEAAERVLIYLGRAPLDSGLYHLAKAFEAFDKSTKGERYESDSPMWTARWFVSNAKAELDDHLPNRRDAMNRLFGHCWFERVWIVQGIAKARSAMVICAGHSFSTRVFAMMPTLLGTRLELHHQAILDVMPGNRRRSSWWASDRSLRSLLYRFRNSKAGVPVDKIYALLAICDEEEPKSILIPDYSRSEHEVVNDTIAWIYGINPSPLSSIPTNVSDFFDTTSNLYHYQVHPQDRIRIDRSVPEALCNMFPGYCTRPGGNPKLASGLRSQRDMSDDGELKFCLARRADILALSRLGHHSALRRAFALDASVATVDGLAAVMNARAIFPKPRSSHVGSSIPEDWNEETSTNIHNTDTLVTRRISQWIGIESLSLLKILTRVFMRDVVNEEGSTSRFATMLQHTYKPDEVIRLLTEQDFIQTIPSSLVLLRALRENKAHGLTILKGVLDRIEQVAKQEGIIGRCELTEFEINNISEVYGSENAAQIIPPAIRPAALNQIMIFGSKSLSRSEQRERGCVPRISETITSLFGEQGYVDGDFVYSVAGLLSLLVASNETELVSILRAKSKTADLCRLVVPSLFSPTSLIAQCIFEMEHGIDDQRTGGEETIPSDIQSENQISQPPSGPELLPDSTSTAKEMPEYAHIRLSFIDENNLPAAQKTTGWTALSRAAATNDAHFAEILLNQGENIDAHDHYGLTPLIWALWLGHRNMAEFLLQHGADIHEQGMVAGKHPLLWAADDKYIEWLIAEYWSGPPKPPLREVFSDYLHAQSDDERNQGRELLLSKALQSRSWWSLGPESTAKAVKIEFAPRCPCQHAPRDFAGGWYMGI